MTQIIRRRVLCRGVGMLMLTAVSLACWSAGVAQEPSRPQPGGLDLNNLDLNNLNLQNLQNLDLKNLDLKNFNLQNLDMQQIQGLLQKYKRKKYPFPYDNVEPGPPVPATMASIYVEFDPRLGIIVPKARKTADVVGIPQGPGADLGSPSGSEGPNLGSPSPNLGNPQPNLGAPSPNLGPPQPNLGPPSPNLGNPSPSAGPPVPSLGKPSASPDGEAKAKPQADADGDKPPEPQPDDDGDERGPLIPVPQTGKPATIAPADVPKAAEGDADAAKQPTPVAEQAGEPPAGFIVPGRHTTRVTGFRAMVARGEFGQPPKFPNRPAKAETNMLELRPVWHVDIPRFFHPAGGLHVFAIVHPFTHRTVCVQVYLPEGRPVVEVDRNDLAFVYGRYDIEIEFERDGRVDVKYGD